MLHQTPGQPVFQKKRKRGENSQDQKQQHNACNLLMANGVCDPVALLRPHVEEEGAVECAIPTHDTGSPVPEDPTADSEDDSWDAETPYEKVADDVPGWVEVAAAADEEVEDERGDVVDEGESDLQKIEELAVGLHVETCEESSARH